MEIYRLWYIKRENKIQGPFPEALICRFIVLGRVGEMDEVSQDRNFWHKADAVPELLQGVQALLSMSDQGDAVEWSEERAKAVMRWLDDRKSPDPRARAGGKGKNSAIEKRQGGERRQNPETVEQHVYREWRGEFESWLRHQRKRYGAVAIGATLIVLIMILFGSFYRPVNPIKVGLRLQKSDCEALPSRGVNWSACIKDDALLVGVDLRGAELIGTRLRHADLRHADLSRANLTHADLAGADLQGARLGEAIWIDGRICAADSIGRCK